MRSVCEKRTQILVTCLQNVTYVFLQTEPEDDYFGRLNVSKIVIFAFCLQKTHTNTPCMFTMCHISFLQTEIKNGRAPDFWSPGTRTLVPPHFWEGVLINSCSLYAGNVLLWFFVVLCKTHIDTWQTRKNHISEAHSRD